MTNIMMMKMMIIKKIFDKSETFTNFDIIIIQMKTTIKHMVISKQEQFCWYRHVPKCSFDGEF